jgi:hypothetical protein
LFCERCGLNFLPKQSVCTRCGDIATRHWLQLMSLTTLMVAVAANALLACFLLPRRMQGHAGHPPSALFRDWWWVNDKIALYGWVPVAIALLAWDFLVWQVSGTRPKVKRWVTRKILTFALLASAAPFVPSWLPAGQPSPNFLTTMRTHPGLPSALAWGVVVVVVTLLCINGETRDSLLGHGKVLSLVSLGILLLLMGLTIFGWAVT